MGAWKSPPEPVGPSADTMEEERKGGMEAGAGEGRGARAEGEARGGTDAAEAGGADAAAEAADEEEWRLCFRSRFDGVESTGACAAAAAMGTRGTRTGGASGEREISSSSARTPGSVRIVK